jgi:hypothetical protein
MFIILAFTQIFIKIGKKKKNLNTKLTNKKSSMTFEVKLQNKKKLCLNCVTLHTKDQISNKKTISMKKTKSIPDVTFEVILYKI